MELNNIVIVGASLAGAQAAQTLRRQNFEGSIVLVGDESHPPYDRPPLSKKYLAGSTEREKLRLRSMADPDELRVDLRLNEAATGLDVDRRVLITTTGELAFDGLILATGARPRRLAGELDGVHVLRTLDDADGLREAFAARPDRVVVIGAGFIGAEVAATAREAGLEVTMIEAGAAPLSRVLDADAGMAIADLHRDNGVDVRLGVGVDALVGTGSVEKVELSDGTSLDADVVVVGIGVIPNTEWLEGSGLTIADGVVCDRTCLAAPGVVAAGDVARWDHPRYGSLRVEQWDNAVDQGGYVAKRLLAESDGQMVEPFAPVPWFWSDQYDRKIQLAGMTTANVEIVQGSIEERRFVQLYLGDDGQPVGVLAWNRPRQAVMARQLLEKSAGIQEARDALA